MLGLVCLVAACDSDVVHGRPDANAVADGGDASVKITVQINNCPQVTTSASPLSTSVGRAISVMAMATDRDVSDNLTFRWSAGSGRFGDAAAAQTTYTCAEAVVDVLTVAVSDGRCDAMSALSVTCQ